MPRFEPNPPRRPAIVGGASSGIGTATAFALAALGHPVALGARRVEQCEALAEKIRGEGGEAVAHFLDVSSTDSVDEFVTAAENALGPTEIVLSGAGDMDFRLVHEMDPDRFEFQVNVHLVGTQRLAHRVLPGMIERRRGDFVVIGSDCADVARPRMGAYVAAKTGLEALVRQMRMELEGTGGSRVGGASRPDTDRDGARRPRGGHRAAARRLDQMGLRPALLLPPRLRDRERRRRRRVGPARNPPGTDRSATGSAAAEGLSGKGP